MGFVLPIIKMSEKTLKFDNIVVNKKEFHKSKQPINLVLLNVDQIVISDKIKHNYGGFKYFIGYKEDDIVKPLCIILPQMSGYIKYFENGGKDMSFVIKDDDMLAKYNEILNKIKRTLNIKLHSMPVYSEKKKIKIKIKTKVKEFNGVIKINFLDNEIPKENEHYACIACINIDSIIRLEKMKYPEVYLEECKYKIKEIKISEFINTELDSDSGSRSE